jgi:transposase
MMNLPALGLDVSKLKFNACLVREGGELRHRVFTNNADGFSQLSDWLSKHEVTQVHARMEATGAYGDALATHPHEQGHMVSVVNPAAIKAYAQSHLSRTKTGRVDAALIAGFCSERKPAATEMHTAEGNRLSSGITVEAVRSSVEELIVHLSEQIKRTQALTREHIDSRPELKRQRELLDSIPGIGEATAAALLAGVPDFSRYRSARQVAASAGLVPRERQSGAA